MAVVQSGKHPVLASVLMGILRALDDESTGKSSSSSEDATCRLHDRGGPPCRRLRRGKSSQVEMKRAEEYIIPPDEEMAPMRDFSLSDSIRTPPGSPHLHTIIETEEEGEDGDKKKKSLIAGRAESLEEKKMDAVKHLQKEEVKVRSSTSSPLVTSDDSDVAAFLSKHEYATLFGPNSGHSDKILIPSRFVQDYGETYSSVRIGQKSPLKRGSGEELQGNQVKKQKSDHKPVGSSLEALGGTGVHSDKTKETGSSVGSPSQRKRLKTEEESDFSSEETLSDTMSDDTVEESTASSVLDDRQVGAQGRRKKKLTKTLKSLRTDSPDVDGMSDLSSDGQMRNLRPSMMPGPKVVLGSHGWKSDAKNKTKSILQKALSTSQEDFSDVLSPDHQSSAVHSHGQGKTDISDTIGSGSLRQVSESDGTMTENLSSIVSDRSHSLVDPSAASSPVTLSIDMSEKKYNSETSDSKFTSRASQSLSASVSTGKSRMLSQSEETTDVSREGANQENISSTDESKSAVEDVRPSESSYISGTAMSSELGRVLTSSEKMSADSAQPSVLQSDLQSSVISSNLKSATSKEDTVSPSIVTSITSETSESISSYIPELSKKAEVPSSDVLKLSSSLSTPSKSGTSSSKQSGIDPRDLPAILRTGTQQPLSSYSSSVTKSIVTSRTSRSEAESTTDVAHVPKLLTNVGLTEALLRSEPSPSEFEDSDTLTSSSDEFITHGLMPDTFHSPDRGFPETSSTTTEAESMNIEPGEVPREKSVEVPIGEKLGMVIDENRVQEIPWITDVQCGYLPVLLEESEESGDDIPTMVEEIEKSDASAFSELEGDIKNTSALQQQFSMTCASESSSVNGDKPSSDDQARLLMIGIDGNETIFDDILITRDTSISSTDSEYLPIKVPEALSFISSEREKHDFAEADCAREIVHYVTLNAVATIVVEIVVNAAITRLTYELDFSLQMEKALFPGIEEEDGDSLIHKHWIAPARYRQKGYAQSQSFEGKGYGGYKWEKSCRHRDRDEEEEAFLLCLERAFFPCLADSDDRDIRRPSSPPESVYHPSPEISLIAKADKTDWKTKLCKSCQLVIMASRVSTVAVGTFSQIWSIVTHLWWMIWIFIRDNCKVSKVERKDQSTQYDEDLATFRSRVSGWEKSDELSLNIKASRIVASAVTVAVVEEAIGNGFVMNDSIRESASATRTEDSNQSEDTSRSSETDSKVDSDACSLSDIPLSSITFMRQQMAEMRDIFQTHISGVEANAFSTPAVASIPTEDAVLSSLYLEESAVCRDINMIKDEIDRANKSVRSTKRREKEKTATGYESIPTVDVRANVDNQKSRKQSPKLDESVTASSADCNTNMSEHVVRDLKVSSSKEAETYKTDMFKSKIVDSTLETRQGDTGILDERSEVQNKINEPFQYLPRSELHGEAVNIKDARKGDSNSTGSPVISISDDPFSGISFIREQLANVKTLATSIMDDFDSYAEERALLAKRSSQLTCSGVLVRSQSSSDSARTIHNKSSGSSSSLDLNRDSKLGESKDFSSREESNQLREYTPDVDQDSKEDDTSVGKRKAHVVSHISGSLGWPNKNGNAMTRKSGLGEEDYAKNEEERDHMKCENTREKGYTNKTSKRQAALVGKKQTHSGAKATKETVRESLQVIGEDDQTRSLQMTETHQTRQIATFQRNSPIRRHVTSRKKEVNHPHGKNSGESTCSTDHSSSIVSRLNSSFSDGSVSSGSKRVTVESESQGRGTTDVSCRISDRGVWVNTAFVDVLDDDHLGNTSMAADSGRSVAKSVKNKIKINVKTSPKNRKKHQSHRVRSGVMTENKMSTSVREEVIRRSEAKSSKTVAEDSHTTDINAYDEVIEPKNCQGKSNRSSPKYEMSEENRHGAMQLLNKLTPRKKSSSDSECSEEYEKAVSKSKWTANQDHVMRDCLSDGAVSEKHQFLNRRQPSPKRKTRETKPQDHSYYSCPENSDHAEDLLAAPVISRSDRTKAVLSMLDDVADNLSLDTPGHDDSGIARTMGRMGSFRKLFHSRKNKRRNGGKMPDHSPRVLSDSSVTESDGDSGSPSYSSDSSHTPRSNSAASLLSNVLRNLSARRSKKKSKSSSSSTPKDRRSKKGSIAAFDEMLADLDDDCFIDDAFPSLVSVRDSASEDDTSLKEVLQDLIEEWSFDGLQEALDFSPQSIGDRIRGKLNQFMAEVRKEKRRAELLFARARNL